MMNELVIDSFRGKYRFLSNFYPCTIVYGGISYPSTEHAYQSAKFDDIETKLMIANLSASDAKRAGKVNVDDWRSKSLRIMYDVCKLKFEQEIFTRKLLATGELKLIEGNTWGDTFWGVCNGTGENYLGRILMGIRNELKGQ